MADISAIKTIQGTTYTVRDYRVPVLTNSTSTYLRGDGTWQIPADPTTTSGCLFIDGGDHLKIVIPSS